MLIELMVLAQTTQPPPMSAFDFWLAVIDRLAPILTPLAIGVGGYLMWLTKREVSKTRQELGAVHRKVDGQGEELRSLTGRAAHAEGVVEGLTQATATPPAPPVIVVPPIVASPSPPPPRDPEARTWASDREPPTSPDPPHVPI